MRGRPRSTGEEEAEMVGLKMSCFPVGWQDLWSSDEPQLWALMGDKGGPGLGGRPRWSGVLS